MRPGSLCPQASDLQRVMSHQASAWDMEQLARHMEECDHCAEELDRLLSEDRLVAALGIEPALPREDGDLAAVVRLQTCLRQLWHAAGALPVADTPVQGGANNTPSQDSLSPMAEPGDFLAPPQAADEIGRLGPYGVLRVLGKGGMGIVFLARQARPRRLVALKMILAGPRAGREQVARFQGETEVVARLSHANIVQVHEAGEHDGRPYFTMEHVDGGSLADRLAAAPLAAEEAARLVQTLARAVQHAHAQGLIHRDLKPSNILLTADSTPKISDFGLAKQLEGDSGASAVGLRTESGIILGTPAYMAPEQAAGDSGSVGPAVDVYSLGAVLYECLTGRPPFRAATLLQTLEQVRSQEPVSLSRLQPGVPRDLETICLKCLHKEPARRYATAEALADDLGRFWRGEPIVARPVSRRERLRKWARRKPALAALLVVSALSLAVVGAGGLIYDSQLRAALGQARTNEAEARRQQQRADTGYQAAREALDRMLQRLGQHRAGEVPRLKELERQQCQDALAFYEGLFAGADDPSAEVRLDAAHAYRRAGLIQRLLGHKDEAVTLFGQAIEMVESLPAPQRDLPETQALLAGCYSDRGMLGGEHDLVAAFTVYERLLQGEPDNPRWQDDLGTAEHRLGKLYHSASRPDDARPHFARAVALRTRLVADHPGQEAYAYALAEDYIGLVTLDMQGNRKVGLATFPKIEELLKPLHQRHPEDIRAAMALVVMNINWSYCLIDDDQTATALDRLGQAVELAEEALRREPTHLQTREMAFRAHGARAQVLERLGRWKDAVKDMDRVVELDYGPDAWARRNLRAVALIHAGDHGRATAEAASLEAAGNTSDDGLYNLACIYALAVEQVRADSRLPRADREALAQRHAGRAMAVLHKLQTRGYFLAPGNAEELGPDADLKALHDRDDFRKLLSETSKGKGR